MTIRRSPRGAAPFALCALLLATSLPLLAQETASPDAAPETTEPSAADAAAPADGAATTGADDGVAATAAGDGAAAEDDHRAHYPTVAIADYVLGCMVGNGNSHQALQQCSCSIDFIMARMDYKAYEQAATVLQVQRDVGQRGIFYRDSKWARSRVERLEALQAESTLRCF